MARITQDLWPGDLTASPITSPVTILREQGEFLGRRTNNIVEGEVVSHTDEFPLEDDPLLSTLASLTMMSKVEREVRTKTDPTFYHSFYLKVPSMGNYRYKLFFVQHSILLYPATICKDGASMKCENEHEFVEKLRSIFADKETQRIVTILMSQGMSTP